MGHILRPEVPIVSSEKDEGEDGYYEIDLGFLHMGAGR
jgi:hypothetical protein